MRVLSILLTIALLEACHSTKDCPEFFQLPVSLSPVKPVYSIGDTLTIVSKFHRNVSAITIENKPAGYYDMEGIVWSPVAFMYRIDTLQDFYSIVSDYFMFIKDPKSNFDMIQYSNQKSKMEGQYIYINDTFYLAYHLVCQKSGTFILVNGSYILDSTQDFAGKCSENGFNVDYQMNSGANNGFNLLKESPDPHWNDWMVKQELYNMKFSRQGGYCFKVLP